MSHARQKRKSLNDKLQALSDQYKNAKALETDIHFIMTKNSISCGGCVLICSSSLLSALYHATTLMFTHSKPAPCYFGRYFLNKPTECPPFAYPIFVMYLGSIFLIKSYVDIINFGRKDLQEYESKEFIQKIVALAPDMGLSVDHVLNSSLKELYLPLKKLVEKLMAQIINIQNNLLGKRFLETSIQLNKDECGIQIFGIYKYKRVIKAEVPEAVLLTLKYLGAEDVADEFEKSLVKLQKK